MELFPEEQFGYGKKIGPIEDRESIVRLLFYPRMVDDKGNLEEICFPTDELIERYDKRSEQNKSVSVIRGDYLPKKIECLWDRSKKMANPENGRDVFGFLDAVCISIREIEGDHPDEGFVRLFKVVVDPVEFDGELDILHSKIARSSPKLGRGFVRGYRDKLAAAFGEPVKFEV